MTGMYRMGVPGYIIVSKVNFNEFEQERAYQISIRCVIFAILVFTLEFIGRTKSLHQNISRILKSQWEYVRAHWATERVLA
jgi:predicted aspartyl protease